jgi:hypothetical protein
MAQFAVVVISLFGIYRQLRAQASGNAIARLESLMTRWESRQMVLSRLVTAIELRDATEATRFSPAMNHTMGFLNDLNNLWLDGHIPAAEIDDNWGLAVLVWSQLLDPVVDSERRREGVSTLGAGTGSLYREMERRFRKRGVTLVIGPAERREYLDEAIRRGRAMLEFLDKLDSRWVPTADAVAAPAEPAVPA